MRHALFSHKGRSFWPLLLLLLLADCATKRLAVEYLPPANVPHEVVGEEVRFTLAYNPGAAFSIDVPRPLLILTTIAVLAMLARFYRRAPHDDRPMAVALALICGGALGNLVDRIQSARGVVDFIDVGVGSYRFWTFNIADVGVTVGAVLLAMLLWTRAQREERA